MKTAWSIDEINFLKELYENKGLSKSEIYPLFNEKYNRTCESINNKIKRLKLSHTDDQTRNIKSRLNSGNKNGMFGKISPLKGLTKNNSPLIKDKSIKLSNTRKKMYKEGKLQLFIGEKNPMYNKKPWNLGLNKNNCDVIFNYGKKISILKKNEWNNKSVEDKKKVTDRLNQSMIQTRKPTKIEIKIKKLLDDYKINFKKNHNLNGFLCDFYLSDYNLVIECDGDYWHGNPNFYKLDELNNIQLKNKDRDTRKNNMLISNSISFLRFWEYDIHNNFDDVKNTILKKINL